MAVHNEQTVVLSILDGCCFEERLARPEIPGLLKDPSTGGDSECSSFCGIGRLAKIGDVLSSELVPAKTAGTFEQVSAKLETCE